MAIWPDQGGLDAADEASLPPIEALTIEPGRGPADVRDEVNHMLGIGTRRVRYGQDGPDVTGLREELGI
ncbi:MAG TPA: hypothetical protein DHU96_21135 [Actinobacteria bacterium]|nr:hypothetical protein [Actinomycetota bacterium]